MTRDAEEYSVGGQNGCRECTLPRNDPSSEPEGWIRERTKIGPVLEANTNYHQGRLGTEIKIESLSGDHSQSWGRISNGRNKFVRDLTEKSRRTPDEEEKDSPRTGQPGSHESMTESNSQKESDRPSAKAKLEPSSSAVQQSSQEIPIIERMWRGVEPDTKHHSTLSHDVSKKMITLLRHDQNGLREEDGAVEFGRLKRYISAKFPHSVRWSHNIWTNNLARRGGGKKRFQFCMNRKEQ